MCGLLVSTDPKTDMESFAAGLKTLQNRGPDASKVLQTPKGIFGFQRLAVMGPGKEGMQPFERNGYICVCNGELYNFRKMRNKYIPEFMPVSMSDCELILPLYEKYGTKMFSFFDAEFVTVIYDKEKDDYIAARDPIGIRPMFYGYNQRGKICFSSTPEALMKIAGDIKPFPPGYYYAEGEFHCYSEPEKAVRRTNETVEEVCRNIHDLLTDGIVKRMDADVPVGYLLSGGLDSSLVCAVAAKHARKKIRTFAIGMDLDAIDLKYAREAADFIGSQHTEVIITKEDVVSCLPEVIRQLGTWDITTIRASIGMYLLCKYIHEHTDIKVLFTGEISDELFGYKYTDFAPDAESFQKEAEKRIHELHMYDVLRADRCISCNSMEGRVPFGDLQFVSYVMGIDPEMKMNRYGIGKYLLRHAFENDNILPRGILMRQKAAFSDAVGHSLADDLREYAEKTYSDQAYEEHRKKYPYRMPYTKESLLYRELFESFYPGMADMIADYWLPNQEWEGCQVKDPSARYLSNYGASGE